MARDPDFADFCRDGAQTRRDQEGSLGAIVDGGTTLRVVSTLGRLHRTWIKFIAPAGDAGLADAIDHGEAALENRLHKTLRRLPTTGEVELREILLELCTSVSRTRDEAWRWRAELGWGVEALPALTDGLCRRRRPQSDTAEADVSTIRKPAGCPAQASLVDGRGGVVDLEELGGGTPVVVTFLANLNRKARRRLDGFNARLPDFDERNTKVVAVARARPHQLKRVAEDDDYDIRLLADPKGELAQAVDAIDTTGSPLDSTMLIDNEGDVLFVSLTAGQEAHAGRILNAVDRYRDWFPNKMGVSSDDG